MLWISGPRRIITILPLLIITLSLLFFTSVQAQQTQSAVIRVTTLDESEKPVSGVVVEVKLDPFREMFNEYKVEFPDGSTAGVFEFQMRKLMD